VADVGTDHGRLPRLLLARGRAIACVATDVRLVPAAVPERWRGRLAFRRGAGLGALEPADAIDVVVVAGLGARAIVRILDDTRRASLGIRRFVLQPQTEVARLRRWLAGAGLAIVDERLACERGRLYPVIAAEPGGVALPLPAGLGPDDVHEAGPHLVRSADPLVRAAWCAERTRLTRLVAAGRAGPSVRDRLALTGRVLAALPGTHRVEPSQKA